MWCGVFSGQGSQHPGMGKFLYDNFSYVKKLFEEASDCLHLDMKKLCFEAEVSELALTENTQPALLVVSHSCSLAVKNEYDFQFSYLAGHSIGEYAACVHAQAISFIDALNAVRLRGQFMQQAVPIGQGSMVAVMGLSDEQVEQLRLWTLETSGFAPLDSANFNSPGQVVLSGSAKAVDWLIKNYLSYKFNPPVKRCKLIKLNVSAPFHSSMMKEAQDKMTLILNDTPFCGANPPVIQNITAQPTTHPDQLRNNLIEQVSGSVRWTHCIEEAQNLGCKNFIELGPGKVLSGLIKKINRDHQCFNLNSIEDFKSLKEHITT